MVAIPVGFTVPVAFAAYFAVARGERVTRYFSALNGIIQRNRMMHQDLRPGTVAEIPHMIPTGLDEVSAELQQLGFEPLGDFVSETSYGDRSNSPFSSGPIAAPDSLPGPPKSPVKTRGFLRAFTHPAYCCCAKVICVVVTTPRANGNVTAKNKITVSLVSYQGLGPGDWSYTTTRGAASPHGALMRHPRRLSTRLPHASIAEMVNTHLQRREEIARLAGITWMRQYTFRDVYEMEKRGMENVRNTFLAMTPFKMAGRLFVLKHEKRTEWLGELAGKK